MTLAESMKMPLRENYNLIYIIGWDAGNRSMRANGRTSWNEDDWNIACAEFSRIAAIETKELDQP